MLKMKIECTEEARSIARGKSLTLIDEEKPVARWQVLPKEDRRRIYDIATRGYFRTPTCPRCGHNMVLRIGAKGRGAGVAFWGCPVHPRCKTILKTGSSED